MKDTVKRRLKLLAFIKRFYYKHDRCPTTKEIWALYEPETSEIMLNDLKYLVKVGELVHPVHGVYVLPGTSTRFNGSQKADDSREG